MCDLIIVAVGKNVVMKNPKFSLHLGALARGGNVACPGMHHAADRIIAGGVQRKVSEDEADIITTPGKQNRHESRGALASGAIKIAELH